jgi:hypothetical protein
VKPKVIILAFPVIGSRRVRSYAEFRDFNENVEADLMTDAMAIRGRVGTGSTADRVLSGAAVLWFLTAAFGQLMFALYIFGFYGRTIATGNFGDWNKVMYRGYISGDAMGNVALGLHLVFAFVMTVGGPLQFIPRFRSRAPRFHFWNGRIYIGTVFLISLGALYLVWARGVIGGLPAAVAISINAVLMMAFAFLAIREAMGRRFEAHRRWAMRLFLASSGVWFFRVGLMLWLLINRGPVGIGKNFDGPFVVTWFFGQYLVPLAVLELYFMVKKNAGETGRFAMAALLVVLTLGTAVGVFGATIGMWLPRL